MSDLLMVRGRRRRWCTLILIAAGMAGPARARAAAAEPQPGADACIHPAGMGTAEVSGVDVSRWQGNIRFDRLPRNIKYVFVKATQGATGVDRDYVSNIRGARAARLAVGSYHYFAPDQDAARQFRHFIANASVEPGDLPPVVDIEVLNHRDDAALAAESKQFLSLLEAHYGARPIIYAGRDFANLHLKGFGTFPLWLAEYTASPKPVLPLDWNNWTFWQKSQRGRIEGIQGCVDLDSFNGDSARFLGLLVKPPGAAANPPSH